MNSCGGCQNNPSDEKCPVRKCVLEKGLNHCGDCGDFPCGVFYQRCGSFPEEKKNCFDILEYNEYILAYDNETRLKKYSSPPSSGTPNNKLNSLILHHGYRMRTGQPSPPINNRSLRPCASSSSRSVKPLMENSANFSCLFPYFQRTSSFLRSRSKNTSVSIG